MNRSYSELCKLDSYGDRLEYLKLKEEPYVTPSLAQAFYKSKRWIQVSKDIKRRDCGFDLGVFGCDIDGKILVHHINPVGDDMIINDDPILYDPENLISSSLGTHNAIHYKVKIDVAERSPNDTKLW